MKERGMEVTDARDETGVETQSFVSTPHFPRSLPADDA